HLRALGVGPEVLVGLCVERSLEMAIGLLGILKAGAAYVPLDPGFPPERLAFMARDSAMPVLVTQRSVADSLPAGPAQTVWLDNFQWQELAPNLQLTLSPDALAYVIYTSGSTGQPKGVEISQRALVNCLCHFQHSLGVGPADVWLAVTTLSFDIAGLELFLPLIAGASVAIASRATAMDPHLLSHALRRHGATILQATPAGWQLLLHSGWQGNPQLQILCGGEAMPRALAESLARLGSRAWNVYGPTETTIWSTAHPLVPGNPVNIGKPLANTRIYVLDAAGQPAPIGVPGDLLIGGDGLARGYRNQPDLTSERFIADPFSTQPAARCYKTGDRARWLTDGSLEFLGRNDLQVKIRGFRIEPGEIEAVLAGHPGLAASAVVAQCHNDGDKALAAFVVGSGQAVPTVESLRQWLATKLPDHMIPSRFFPLPVLPLTPNGKLDRKALEQMNGEALTTDTQHVAARSELECELVAIWQSVLRRERVGIHDNFFTLGGHSLVAVAICSQIIRQLAREVPLRWLFEHPTIAQLAEQIQSLGAHPPDAGPIIRADRSQPLPMSFAQQGMWLLHQTLADPATYNESLAWQFSGKVDRQCCRRAVQVIHERHEVLRTALLQQGEQLVQQVGTTDEVPLPWHEVDLQTQPPESQPEALTDLLLDNARRPFDLAQPPLWRALWIQLSPGEQVLQLTFHHSIIDEWSMRRLCAELEQLYAADGQTELAGLPDLPLQYADYAAWQRQRLCGDLLEQQRQYWDGQLRDLPPALELPGDFPRPARPSGRGAIHAFQLTTPLVSQLRDLARAEGCTLFALVLAAFHVWLHRYTGEADVVVCTPVANRLRPEIDSLLGLFINTLPIRLRMDGNPAFREVLGQARHSLMEAFSHAELPFEQMAAMATAGRDPGQLTLYQVMFVLLEEGLTELKIAGAQARQLPVTTRTSKNDLTLFIAAEGDSWECHFEYALDLFTADTAARMGRHFAELLNSITADPSLSISQLNLMPAAERHQIQVEWNQTQRDYPRDKCVHHLFEEQVARNPEAVAVVFEDTSLTYSELNARANQLAHHLRALGVGPEVLVGLCVERSEVVAIALLAVLKAGGALVPIDPTLPPERIGFIMADARIPWLLTRSFLLDKLPPTNTQLLCLDRDWGPTSTAAPGVVSAVGAQPLNLAYAIYTSGSTGRPKGVLLPHDAYVNYCAAAIAHWQYLASDRVLQFANFSFDVSIDQLVTPLLAGATVVIRGTEIWDPAIFSDIIRKHRLTVVHTPPIYWQEWVNTLTKENCRDSLGTLRLVQVGGDVMPLPTVRRWRELELHSVRLFNRYGPTETTMFSTAYEVTATNPLGDGMTRIPIGRPVGPRQLHILDAHGMPVPVGIPGEIHIGGPTLARGYLNRAELTAERFIPDPFSTEPGARLYKTGDWGRFLPDGNIDFIGRIDFQVKIRGFRIELGEIETALAGHPELTSCAVVVQCRDGGDKSLAAFVAGSAQAAPTVDALRQWLAAKLPDYMIPSRFFVLPTLPLTPNGKVDRKALEQMGGEELTIGTEHVAARTDMERQLVEIWQIVLRREQVGIHDDFFTLGGHSLLAVAICSRLTRRIEREVPLRWLFEHPTIAQLAVQIQSLDAQLRDASPITRADRSQPLPMSFAQQGMWLLQQTLADPATYNQPVAWHLSGKVDPQRCRRSLQTIHERHEVLRSALLLQGDELVQQVGSADELPLPWLEIDLQTLPPETQADALAGHLLDEARRPFDLAQPPLWRAAWARLASDQQVLQLTFHHSIIDEWSKRQLFAELQQLYAADGQPVLAGHPELPLQYADYAVWQRQRLSGDQLEQQRQYWAGQLRDLPPALELPGDFPRPAHPSGRGASHAFQITAPLVTRLRDLARAEGCTVFTLILAAFHVWLHRYTGEPDVVVGTPVANRLRPEIESLVGFFLNTLPLRLRMDGNPAFRDVLAQARHSLMQAFSHAELPFEQMVAMAPA
ncbi:MAG: amino acid adenylation domain-containing protein, partial [Verrucomicrobiota bacterium]